MPRPLRNAYPGGFFHVSTRGNSRCRIFLDATDYKVFLMLLDRSERKYNWRVYSWCLMTTHYHLVVATPDGGLSQGISELNGSFARWSNLRHEREDHLFGKRFGSSEILTDAYLKEACRYVVLNPVRAGIRDDPAEWRWSSYRPSAGYEEAPPYLALGELWSLFDRDRRRAISLYRDFIDQGVTA
ncbi:MAG: transposase [Actinomycetota bacterium]|nr:transposase [Actinomycetota bacterium]